MSKLWREGNLDSRNNAHSRHYDDEEEDKEEEKEEENGEKEERRRRRGGEGGGGRGEITEVRMGRSWGVEEEEGGVKATSRRRICQPFSQPCALVTGARYSRDGLDAETTYDGYVMAKMRFDSGTMTPDDV